MRVAKAKAPADLAVEAGAAPESLEGLELITKSGCPSCGSHALSVSFLLGIWFCNLCHSGTPMPKIPRTTDPDPDARDHTAEDLADRYPTYEEA